MTAIWLAPDGREWGARRLRRPPRVPVGPIYQNLPPALLFVPPVRTPVARAVRHLAAEVGAGPLGRAALWALYR